MSGERLGGLYHGNGGVFDVAFDPARSRILSVMQRELLLWEGTTLKREWNLHNDSEFRSAAFSPDGRIVAVARTGGTAQLYRTEDGGEVRLIPATPGRQPVLRGFSFTKRGDELVIGDRDASRIRVVDVTGKRSDRFVAWGHPLPVPKKGGASRPLPPDEIESLAHSPDGSTLAVGCNDKTVRHYETLTWGLRGVVPVDCFRVTFTPDSRHLVIATYKSGLVRQFDWRVPARPGEANDRFDWDEAWEGLASLDAAVAYQAICRFARNADKALPTLAVKVKPVRVADETVVRRLVTELGAPDFRKREAATTSLAELGLAAEPHLRGALTSSSPEVVGRATRLLGRLTRVGNPERLRQARAVELLEYIGTPAAIRVFQDVAAGALGLLETEEAAAALARLRMLQGR